MRNVRPLVKVGLVLAGYLGAFLVAAGAFYVRMRQTAGDPDAHGGMQAFGDVMLFIFVFGFTALLPTGLALYFLRPVRRFWTVVSMCALALASTGVVAAVLYWTMRSLPRSESPLYMAGELSVQRTIVAPLFIAAFLFGAVFAPAKGPRWALAIAAVCEAVSAAPWFLSALASFISR